MPKRIEDLPLNYQQLYHEFSLEKDINEGLNSEIIIYPTNFEENKQIKFDKKIRTRKGYIFCIKIDRTEKNEIAGVEIDDKKENNEKKYNKKKQSQLPPCMLYVDIWEKTWPDKWQIILDINYSKSKCDHVYLVLLWELRKRVLKVKIMFRIQRTIENE